MAGRIHARFVGHHPDDPAIRVIMRRAGDLDRNSAKVLTESRLRVGVHTGTVLASLRREFGETRDGPYVDVTAGVEGLTDYLGYHMDGTPPHVIRPRRREALRFVGSNGVVFAAKVNHPGTAPNPFLTDALHVVFG